MIRLHRLNSGDALDRRVLEELFLEAVAGLNNIGPRSFGDNIIGRDSFSESAFMEMWYVKETDLSYQIPGNPLLVPGTSVAIKTDDAVVSGILTYTIEAQTVSDGAVLIGVWPIFGGQSLWGGSCYSACGDELGYAGHGAVVHPDEDVHEGQYFALGDKVTLSGSVAFLRSNGRAITGVMVFSVGRWKINSAQLHVRTRVK